MSRHLLPPRLARTRLYAEYIPQSLDVGAVTESDFVTVYPGMNVWNVWQVNDLPFSIMMIGVSRDRQLRIWVEDQLRLGAHGAVVADPIDLKGGQIEILNGPPTGLKVDRRKEQVSGPTMVVDGPATLRTVRFFNRGDKAVMAWPHDESYLLDQTYIPDVGNPATSGPAPDTIGTTIGKGATTPILELGKELVSSPLTYIVGAGLGLYLFRKELFSDVRKKLRNRRASRSG